jgi:hypothetical protein
VLVSAPSVTQGSSELTTFPGAAATLLIPIYACLPLSRKGATFSLRSPAKKRRTLFEVGFGSKSVETKAAEPMP